MRCSLSIRLEGTSEGGFGRPFCLTVVHKMPVVRTVAIAGSAWTMGKPNLRLVTPTTENRTVILCLSRRAARRYRPLVSPA